MDPGMERLSDKHSPRVDDQLSHEVEPLVDGGAESHSREDRLQEPMVDEDTSVDPAARWDEDHDSGIGVSPRTADERGELAKVVTAAPWPATRHELVAAARDTHAPDRVLSLLEELPHGDRRYENVQAVWAALGGDIEAPHA
jgi:hypothetical protein